MKKKSVTTQEFDKLFDEGKDITEFLDLKTAKVEGWQKKRVNIELPIWMIQKLDQQAMKLGVTRQSIIKILDF
jgi:hypothetical protein